MSSLFSDPPFGRGQTLLGGEVIEYSSGSSYTDWNPVAGREVVGQIKAFQDFHPVTRARLSNELVYCVAARFKPASATTILNPGNNGADRGKAVQLRMASTDSNLLSTAEFTDTHANAADVLAGERVGFIDEYLTTEIRANDIIWLVVRGPAMCQKTTGAAINAGAQVSLQGSAVTTGLVVTQSNIAIVTTAGSERVAMGQAIGSFNEATQVVTLGGNAGTTTGSNQFVRVLLTGINWGV